MGLNILSFMWDVLIFLDLHNTNRQVIVSIQRTSKVCKKTTNGPYLVY